MTMTQPMFASERTAAKLLDMKPCEFRELVNAGALPKPVTIGPFQRWDTVAIQRIISGAAISDEFET